MSEARSGWPFVRTVIHLEVVGSTNDVARVAFVGGQEARPILVLTDRQTAGRGRGTHSWWSDEGSLTFTIAFDPADYGLRTEHEPRIALVTALAVIEALETILPALAIGIRWPNDLEAGGRKFGGILPERIDKPCGVLVGVGLNVNTRLDEAPGEIARMATSLAELAGKPLEKDDILRSILGRCAPMLHALSREDPVLAERWASRDVLLGQDISVDSGGTLLTGRALGVTARGGLRLGQGDRGIEIYGGSVLRNS
jgi:BirA family biotin operon repressor/biotin-[acetyl-CoA-carboxylase] ligase